jgi:hypothetical protein
MLGWLLERLRSQWCIVEASPIPFVTVVVICAILIYLFFRWRYKEKINDILTLLNVKEKSLAAYKDRFGSLQVDEYLKKYPPNKQGKSYELIQANNDERVFLHDFKTKLKHHIANPETMNDLGFDWGSIRRGVSRQEIDSINNGTQINSTR